MDGCNLILDGLNSELKMIPGGAAVYNLEHYDRVIVVGASKRRTAGRAGLEEILGDYLTGGHVIRQTRRPVYLQKDRRDAGRTSGYRMISA